MLNIPAAGILSISDNPTYQLPNKFLFSQVFAFVDGKHHHLMEENIWLNVKKKMRQNIDSHDVTSFFPFSPHMFSQNWLFFFHVICFLRTGCFFHVICFIKTGCSKCCLFWLLSILCFVVKNDLRQKIYFRFFSKIQYAASDVTFFSPFFASYVSSKLVVFFTSYVSSELVVFFHVIRFIKTGWFKCLVFGWFCCETMLSLLTKLANLFC